MKKLLLALLLFFLVPSSYAQSAEILSKLHQQLNVAKSDTERVRLLGDAVWILQSQDLHLADSISQIELQIAERSSDLKSKGLAYNDAGVVKYGMGDFTLCKQYYLQSLAIREKSGDQEAMGSILIKIGALNLKQGDYEKALECFFRCVRIYEKLEQSAHVAYCLNNIANVYVEMHKSDKILEYSYQSLAINLKNKDSLGIAYNYNSIANALCLENRTDSALIFFNKAYHIYEQINFESAKPGILNNIATVYETKHDTITAIKYYLLAIQKADSLGIKNAVAFYSKNVGDAYIAVGNYAAAERYLLKGYEIAKKENQLSVLADAAINLSRVAANKGDYSHAYQYQLEAMQARDSVYNEESSKQIAEMQTKYETEKKEQQLQIQQLQINRRNIILIVVSLLFLLSGVISWLAYNRYKLNQKAIMSAEILRQQQLRSKAVLDAEEQERQRIGKDLHDGVGQLLSVAKLNLSSLQSILPISDSATKDKMQNALDLIDDSVKEVRTISHNMMPNMLLKSGLVSAVRDFVNKMSSGDKLKIDLDISGMNQRLDNTIEAVLYRVFQEIITNIIRHSDASHITIQLLQHEAEIVLMIEDNGKGFDVEQTVEDENGIGIKNITSRVDYLHGTIHFDSVLDRGTIITVEIPLIQ